MKPLIPISTPTTPGIGPKLPGGWPGLGGWGNPWADGPPRTPPKPLGVGGLPWGRPGVGRPLAPISPRFPQFPRRIPIPKVRFPPKAALPIGIGGIGAGILGIAPEIMEALAPAFWDAIGWKPQPPGGSVGDQIQMPSGGRLFLVANSNGSVFNLFSSPSPFQFHWFLNGKRNVNGVEFDRFVVIAQSLTNSQLYRIDTDRSAWSLPWYEQYNPGTSVGNGNPTRVDGISPGLPAVNPSANPAFGGLPIPAPPWAAPIPGVTPGSPALPRTGVRPDAYPGTAPNALPRTRNPAIPTPGTNDPAAAGNCRLPQAGLSDLQSRIAELDRFMAQIYEGLTSQITELKEQNNPTVQTTSLSVPYVTEGANGDRSIQTQVFTLFGLVNVAQIQDLLVQTANWAKNQAEDFSQKTFELLGGTAVWGAETPQASVNLQAQLKSIAQSAHDAQGNGQARQLNNALEYITSAIAEVFYGEGLHQYPAAAPDSPVARNAALVAGLDLPASPPITNKNDLTRWQTDTLLEPLGAWHQTISIPAANANDPATEVVFPDIASALTELITTQLQQIQQLSWLKNAGTRTAIEAAAGHQESAVTNMNLQAIIEYLNFDFIEEPVNVALSITLPNPEDLEQEEQERTV